MYSVSPYCVCVYQLNDAEVVKRRPPARLESLKAKKEQTLTSKEDIEEKIRLAEERRKVQCVYVGVLVCDRVPQCLWSSSLSPSHGLSVFFSPTHFSVPLTLSQLREDELKMRLRAKSARVRVRAPVSRTEEDEDTSLSPVERLESALSPNLLQNTHSAAEVEECVRESGGGSKECKKEMGRADERESTEKVGVSGDNRGEGAERISEDSNGEEEDGLNDMEEFLIAQGELESDSSFQHAEDNLETF